MKNEYDIIVVGACTAGAYFARNMAEKGYSVLVLEKSAKEDVGKRLDIFHMDKQEMLSYSVPVPQPGDRDYYHSFEYSASRSALGNWEKRHEHTVLVLDLAGYIGRLADWAEQSGVEFSYESEFKDFLFDDEGKICGVKAVKDSAEVSVKARLVADCSVIGSSVRRKLPDLYGVENFKIDGKSKFYVICRYIHFADKEKNKVTHTISWPYYKVWLAPQQDSDGALLGVGANLSFDYAERSLENFLDTIGLDDYTVDYIQKGATPYRRPPYSFVADGYICMGDSACLTKPSNGEGVTAAWYLSKIAVDIVDKAMQDGKYPTREALWEINPLYQSTQGADFATLLAQLTGAVDCTKEENDYEFKKSIIFKDNLLNSKKSSKFADALSLAGGLLGGVLSSNISIATVKKLLHYSSIASKIKKHYRAYPANPEDFPQWEIKANELWGLAGTMADVLE